jgi:phospholipid/cholesterol/gamma-HCH transport system ATP-binding protein
MSDHVVLENVVLRRGLRRVFDGVTVTIPRGKVVAIMGPSGTGKTTLMRLIGGQVLPDSGRVIVNDQDIPRLTRSELFAARRHMGMLFQSGALFTDMTVFDNVAFPIRVHTALPETMIRDLVLLKLESVGLRGAAPLFPNELSGGMNRRVALARAIALDPDIIMYDEPVTGLDPIAMGVIVSLISTLNQVYGMTSIIVSHDIAETASIADLIFLLADGKIIASGTPEEIYADQAPRVKQFVGGLPDGPVPFHYPAADLEEELLESDAEPGR